MSVVVERGLARCPRCVAVADYTFVESGPNTLRYEVRCARCGEAYCEVHTPTTPTFSTAVEAIPFRPPASRVPAGGGVRRWVQAALATSKQRAERVVAWIKLGRNAFHR